MIMALQCTGASCDTCENWNKDYIAPNPDFHFCKHLNMFTMKKFYCSSHLCDEDYDYDDNEE
jgi:hypothetical protein